MSIRDPRATGAYFDEAERLVANYTALHEAKAHDLELARTEPKRWMNPQRAYVDSLFRRFIFEYSRGMPVAELGDLARNATQAYVEKCSLELEFLEPEAAASRNSLVIVRENYIQKLWCMSFAVLFNFEASESKALVNAVGNAGVDGIVDRFESYLGADIAETSALTWPSPYRRLLAVFDADEAKRPAVMAGFLKYWYPQNKQADWWGWHERIAEGIQSYVGYWCFEAAAVVVILDIDDSTFRDNEYYPADLVDWARAQKEANE